MVGRDITAEQINSKWFGWDYDCNWSIIRYSLSIQVYHWIMHSWQVVVASQKSTAVRCAKTFV